MRRTRTTLGPLDATLVDAGAEGEDGPPELLVVLCHGYGAPGEDLVGLAPEVFRLAPTLAGRVRFVFPQAPLSLAGLGLWDARAWWNIDVGRYERALAEGAGSDAMDRLTGEEPEGMAPARRKLLALLDELQRTTGLGLGRMVLGGFSQGAMLTTDVALRLEDAPAALVIHSGILLCRQEWGARAPRRAGLQVLQSHGRLDPLLPFVIAERLRDLLVVAGLDVRFLPFDGPHTIPLEGVAALADLVVRAL